MGAYKGSWESDEEIAARWGVPKATVSAMIDNGYVDWERDPKTDRYMAVKRAGRPGLSLSPTKITGTWPLGLGTCDPENPYTLENFLLAITLPIWIIPMMLYDAFNPPPGGGIDYVQQECTQWLYGTGKYANRD